MYKKVVEKKMMIKKWMKINENKKIVKKKKKNVPKKSVHLEIQVGNM